MAQVSWVPHSFAYFANEWALRAAVIGERLYRVRFDPSIGVADDSITGYKMAALVTMAGK